MKKRNSFFTTVVLRSLLVLLFPFSTNGQATHPNQPYPADAKINFVRTWAMLKPITNPQDIINSTNPQEVQMSTEYLDGLGRPLQTVVRKASFNNANLSVTEAVDMVSMHKYDEFSREPYQYLPFGAMKYGGTGNVDDGEFKNGPVAPQHAFYASNPDLSPVQGQNENYFYHKNNFEPSPLNRILESFKPGKAWAGSEIETSINRSIKYTYLVNTGVDAVRIWNVTDHATLGQFGSYNIPGIYPAGELSKTIITDEHGKQVIEFKDKEGKVILKKIQLTAMNDNGMGADHPGWICTYYVYDEGDDLRAVIQPKAVDLLVLGGWATNGAIWTDILNEQCFRYEYDVRNRMIAKKIPGASPVLMIYDTRDRLVLTQDGNMGYKAPAPTQWLYTKYDALNRPIATGMWTTTITFNTHYNNAYAVDNYPEVSGSAFEEFTQTFYDDYTWLANSSYSGHGLPSSFSTTDNSEFNNSGADDNTTYPYTRKIISSNATRGMATGGRTKVLGQNVWLYSAIYYDEYGRPIQVQNTNITGGADISTTQYGFTGQIGSTLERQQITLSTAQAVVTVSKNAGYDIIGRPTGIQKKIRYQDINQISTGYKTISIIKYDGLGQLKIKHLGQKSGAATGTPLETQTYSYNIRGWLLGINRSNNGSLAATTAGSTPWFAFDLGYANLSAGKPYVKNQYNGNIGGMTWRSAGDGEERRYDYDYDAANRLMKADFSQYTGSSFNQNAGLNFNVKMGDGLNPLSAYDANGNINAMTQYGFKLGVSPSVPIDQLSYNYINNTNNLLNVIDQQNDADTKLGDFRASSYYQATVPVKNVNTQDYQYDFNGNLVKDRNKDIKSISYNHLNLPSVIIFDNGSLSHGGTPVDKGIITYTYDANGNKLKKQVQENIGDVSLPLKTTLYIDDLVYENDVFQFKSHEEGRIRFKPAQGIIAASLEFDYMLKDHLGNVRMVLTEEQQQNIYPAATLEPLLTATENSFYTIDQTKIVPNSVANYLRDLNQQPQIYPNNNGFPNNNPNCGTGSLCTTDNSGKLYQLNSSSNKTGLGITLKVMAGDKIDIHGKSYYFQNNTGGSGVNTQVPILEILGGLLGAPMGGTAVGWHGSVTATELNGYPGNVTGIGSLLTQQTNDNNLTPQKPKAYINYIFFDEQFKYVNAGTSPVGSNSELKNHFAELQNLAATKNGYVYIYCSNESPVNVFFDNVQVIHTKGPLLEETHYYPFGLTMAGISSKAAGGLENRKKFNDGTELNTDLDLNWYETEFRSYDPQIGRFWQLDELAELDYDWSPYAYCYNNPILLNDPLGLTAEEAVASSPDAIVSRPEPVGETLSGTAVGRFVDQGSRPPGFLNNLWNSYKKFDRWLGEHGGDWINENINPITPFAEFITRKEFKNGQFIADKPRLQSLKEAVITVIPGGKLVGTGGKLFVKGISKVALKGVSKSIYQLNKLVKTGNAPKTISRFDKGKIFGELDHVHFKNGAALNIDGSWKHGSKILSNSEIKFLKENGWTLPK